MQTVQMTLDEVLVKMVDEAAKALKTTRSAFTREALRQALNNLNVQRMEARHRQGYARKPVVREEFGAWESEQKWGDA